VQPSNRLAQEKSPYLLQHKDNPVDWFPWGDEAFSKAKAENKPVFLSIGYSTCYWCHVMEKECFEAPEVAQVLNTQFVCIKVDREERPDVDGVYMDALVAMTGQGGWPLSAMLTPDRKPFFSGTYFPKSQFLNILEKITELWNGDREKVLETSEGITNALKMEDAARPGSTPMESTPMGTKTFRNFYERVRASFDGQFGGFGGAPKFPAATTIQMLFRIYRRTGDAQALSMATHTLECMARGGIYDHLEGGFARYSTDVQWSIPHFEKMLYDNALLLTAYLEAYQITKAPLFASVARETLDYVIKRMSSEDGGFYSAEDAGDVGKEGEFYVWQISDLQSALNQEEISLLTEHFGVSERGNFDDGKNVLVLQSSWEEKEKLEVTKVLDKLRALREKRRRPHLDDKMLCSWNALMISAMCKGYQVLGDESYLCAAQKSASFILDKLYVNNRLLRRFREGDARFDGVLEDYAYLIQALLDLYESDFSTRWLDWAKELQETQNEIFWDEKDKGYFYSAANKEDLIIRKKDFSDGAMPSSNAISARNLLRFYHLEKITNFKERAEQIFGAMRHVVEEFPPAFSSSLIALDFFLDNTLSIVLHTEDPNSSRAAFAEDIHSVFIPNRVLSRRCSSDDSSSLPAIAKDAETLKGSGNGWKVCEEGACQTPSLDSNELKDILSRSRQWSLHS
jgi:hypothetical protein